MSRYHLKQYEKEHMKMAMLKQEETFRQQVQELHRLYRVQQVLMTDAANETIIMAMPPAAAARCNLDDDDDDERRAAENDAGSSRSWPDGSYSRQHQGNNNKAPAPLVVLQESELELTLALGCFGTAGTKKKAAAATKKEEAASSSVDSRTSISSSTTESGGSPDGCGGVRRRLPPRSSSSLIGSSVPGHQPTGAGSIGQRLEHQEGLPQPPPWLHKCLNLAR